jgi:hypothetical protein
VELVLAGLAVNVGFPGGRPRRPCGSALPRGSCQNTSRGERKRGRAGKPADAPAPNKSHDQTAATAMRPRPMNRKARAHPKTRQNTEANIRTNPPNSTEQVRERVGTDPGTTVFANSNRPIDADRLTRQPSHHTITPRTVPPPDHERCAIALVPYSAEPRPVRMTLRRTEASARDG